MASKKQKEEEARINFIMYMIPFIALAVVFGLYHYAKLKKKYLTGSQVRRVFDVGTNWPAMLMSGILAFCYFVAAMVLYEKAHWTLVFSLPLALIVLNWMGELQAHAFLGVVVDYGQGAVFIPPSAENLDIVDSLLVLPGIRQLTTLDFVLLDEVEKITRQAGTQLFLHGSFGSRRIGFSSKLKRDECIHLLTASGRSRAKLVAELE